MNLLDNKIKNKYWMNRALFYANKALLLDEIPIGAVLVFNNIEIAYGFNITSILCNSTFHAEINAIKNGFFKLSKFKFCKTILYITLEPCSICLYRILSYNISNLIFGAYRSQYSNISNLLRFRIVNKKLQFKGGFLSKNSSKLLKYFFKNKRLN